MSHVTCIVHAVHRVCVTIRRSFPKLDRFMISARTLITNSPNRIRIFNEVCKGAKRPPAPSGTRFGSWIQCANYYTVENLKHLSRFVERLKTEIMTKTELEKYNENKLVLLVAAHDEDLYFDFDDENDNENENENKEDAEEFEIEVLSTKRKNNKSLSSSLVVELDKENINQYETSPKKKQKKQSLAKEKRHRKIDGFNKLQALCSDKEIMDQAAFIQKHFEFIPRYLQKLQTNNMDTRQAIDIVERMRNRLHYEIPNIRPAIIEHFDDIFERNEGYVMIKDYLLIGTARGTIAELSEQQKLKLKKHN